MRVLCCLDGTNRELLHRAVSTFLSQEGRTMAVLYVTDTGPLEEMERHRERFLRPPHLPAPRREQMQQAETASAQEILEEGSRLLGGAEQLRRAGRPEREIVQAAEEWQADLLVICSRSTLSGGPPLGPKSIGHVARFVLDHAPCPVLLVR
ncbi:MAG: universal stress protein [Chloroflexi bacterium]|nr:universal stress protein [Chloroflexota bacterium]